MNVKDLKELLSTLPDDAPVLLDGSMAHRIQCYESHCVPTRLQVTPDQADKEGLYSTADTSQYLVISRNSCLTPDYLKEQAKPCLVIMSG